MARSNTETRYRVLFAGNEIGAWRDPECSAAWWLVDNRLASRDDVLQTYSGDLVVVAVPKGSVWSLTLSDLPKSPLDPRHPCWGAQGGCDDQSGDQPGGITGQSNKGRT